MKKLIFLALLASMLLTGVSCGKDKDSIVLKGESELGEEITIKMECPADSGIVYSEGDTEACAIFTDEEDCYEVYVEILADTYTDFDYFREDTMIYSPVTLGGSEAYLLDQGDLLIYYVPLGEFGDEFVYLEIYALSLVYDSSVDLKAMMAKPEINELMSSIKHEY